MGWNHHPVMAWGASWKPLAFSVELRCKELIYPKVGECIGNWSEKSGLVDECKPRSLTCSPLKMDGWKTILSFWVPVTFQGFLAAKRHAGISLRTRWRCFCNCMSVLSLPQMWFHRDPSGFWAFIAYMLPQIIWFHCVKHGHSNLWFGTYSDSYIHWNPKGSPYATYGSRINQHGALFRPY